MARFFIVFILLLSSVAHAETYFLPLPWRIDDRISTYVAVMPGAALSSAEYLADGKLGQSHIYGASAKDVSVKVPSLHAYNPDTFRFAAIEVYPELIQLLPALPVPPAQVTKFFISIEKLDTEPLLFRPHRFADRDTPHISANPAYNKPINIKAAVFNLAGQQVPFADLPGDGLRDVQISVHVGGGDTHRPQDQILSGDSMKIEKPVTPGSFAYYSIVQHQDDKSRVAVTLHWMIDGHAQVEEMMRLLKSSPSVEEFVLKLPHSSFGNTDAANIVETMLTTDLYGGV